MANTVFKLRRSSVSGKWPNTSTLAIGELAINLTDRKLFSSDGANTFELGANLVTLNANTIYTPSLFANTEHNNYLIVNNEAVIQSVEILAGLKVANSYGNSGLFLTSNGSVAYWANPSSTVEIPHINQTELGNGVKTNFAITGGYDANNISVYVNGVRMTDSEANTASGTNVVFTTPPVNGSIVEFVGYILDVSDGSHVKANFTGDGSTNTFVISGGYDSNNLKVYLNGIKATGTEVNTASGANIVFVTAPSSGVNIDVEGVYNLNPVASYVSDVFTGDGITDLFNTTDIYDADRLTVYLNGVKMSGSEANVSTGSSILFSTPPANGAIIETYGIYTAVPTSSVNVDSTYTWTNVHTFNSNVYIGTTLINSTSYGGTSNNTLYLGNVAAASYVQNTDSRTLSGNLVFSGANIQFTGIARFGNGTFAKSGFATGDILLDNGGTDTPGILFYHANNKNWGIDSIYNGSNQTLRFVTDLNESGGAVKATLDTDGNFTTTGYLAPQKWQAGQVIKETMLGNSELTVISTTIATSGSTTNFVTYNYTPVSDSSYLLIHFHLSRYQPQGTTDDSWYSQLLVGGSEIAYGWQMVNDNGTGTSGRSGVLFPLMGRFTNSNTAVKQIQVAARRDAADDSIVIDNSGTSMWLRITEIAR